MREVFIVKEKGKAFGVEAILKTVNGTITCVNICETIQPFLEKVYNVSKTQVGSCMSSEQEDLAETK